MSNLIIDESTASIGKEIAERRRAAHRKHGTNSIEAIEASDPRWLSIIVEEIGEIAHEMTYDAGGTLDTIRHEALDALAVLTALVATIDQAQADPKPAAWEDESGNVIIWGTHDPVQARKLYAAYLREAGFKPGDSEYDILDDPDSGEFFRGMATAWAVPGANNNEVEIVAFGYADGLTPYMWGSL